MAKLTRSNKKVVAGVCGGLAEFFGLSASAVRIVFVLLLFITFGSVCIAYLILMLILPTSPQNSADSYVQRMNDKLKK